MTEHPEAFSWLMLLPIGVGALLALASAWYWLRGAELRAQGVAAEATIIARRGVIGRRGDVYEFTLQFADTEGRMHTATVTELKLRSAGIREGRKLRVVYVPANPDKVEIGYGWGKQIEGAVVMLFGIAGIGMMGFGLWELLRHAIAAQGG